MEKYKVLVLLSSYNGEQYIAEQLDSILSQELVDVSILIRDDGSTDRTIEIAKKKKKTIIYSGENLGPAFSFYDLLIHASKMSEFDYYSLSDQDDIWNENKIYEAIVSLEKNNGDLYSSSLKAFSSNDVLFMKKQKYDFLELMERNDSAGCTMVFNKKVLSTVLQYEPQWMEMHDSWIRRVCEAKGLITVVDQRSFINYRLHDNNVCGQVISLRQRIIHKLKYELETNKIASRTAHELLLGYSSGVNEETKKVLTMLECSNSDFKQRCKLLLYSIKSSFSNSFRKADFIIKVLMRRI